VHVLSAYTTEVIQELLLLITESGFQ
jgi:hypothetical protein